MPVQMTMKDFANHLIGGVDRLDAVISANVWLIRFGRVFRNGNKSSEIISNQHGRFLLLTQGLMDAFRNSSTYPWSHDVVPVVVNGGNLHRWDRHRRAILRDGIKKASICYAPSEMKNLINLCRALETWPTPGRDDNVIAEMGAYRLAGGD